MKDVIIVGAGGFGPEILQYVSEFQATSTEYNVKGFLDDDPQKLGRFILGHSVIGNTTDYTIKDNDWFIMAIGQPGTQKIVAERLRHKGARFLTIIHPKSYVADSAELGEGCIICPFCNVSSHAKLGRNVVLTCFSTAAHHSQLGDYSVLSPYSAVNGGAIIGEAVFLGTGSAVNPNKRVGNNSKIAAGSYVYRDVAENMIAMGNPAKARPILL